MVNIPKLKEKQIQLYEVIRIIDNIPLFLEDHMERLYHSAAIYNIKNLPQSSEIEEKIFTLIDDEDRETGNIKLNFNIRSAGSKPEIGIDFIPHFYPPEEKYRTGVKVGILSAERPNPQAKIQHTDIRNKANMLMDKEKVFEVLLVDHENNITEGSRSNVFFVEENELFTSPDNKILQGITRKKILQLCSLNSIKVTKTDISLSGIGNFNGAFLTGSSPKVLPVNSIGDVQFETSQPLIKRVIALYNEAIDEYIANKKKLRDKNEPDQ